MEYQLQLQLQTGRFTSPNPACDAVCRDVFLPQTVPSLSI